MDLRPLFAGVAASNRIPPGVWMSVLVSVVCCQVEVSASGRLLVQSRATECGVPECDREASTGRRPWHARGLLHHGEKNIVTVANNKALERVVLKSVC